MPNHPIFPSAITEFSEESLIKRHSTKSKAIYWLLIFVVIGFGVSVFWAEVDVNVHSRGLVSSEEKATKISTPVFGTVQNLFLTENSLAHRGDTLLIIDTNAIKKSRAVIVEKRRILEIQNADLDYLSALKKKSFLKINKLKTQLYKQELQKFKSDLRFQKSEMAILKKSYQRQKILYKQKVIPKSEFEQSTYKYENARLRYHQLFDTQLSAWQKQLNQNQTQIYSLNENLNQVEKEIEKYFVIAPITGYIQNLSGIKEKALVYPNQEICTISPTTSLIVETYVSTADIGLIKDGQEVKFRVDAFNYNQWGMLQGSVKEIAKDITLHEGGVPTFKIRCQLENTQLRYKGKTVSIKKGMSVNANFFLTRRTLAQLFYDKMTDWLDPNSTKQGV